MKKQSLNLIGYISIIMVILGLHSCEYESNNINYVELDKPEDEVQFGIDFAGVNPDETIYIENNSIFYYTLFTDGRDVLVRQFYWDGVPIETNHITGGGHIYINNIDNDIHELKLIIALKTGTESLAEYAGLEMYAGEYNFKVKVFDNKYDGLNLRQEVNSDGHLKLVWDKPDKYEVESYNVYNGGKSWGKLLATIYDPDETFFVDTEYTYGYKNLTVEAIVKNSFDLRTYDEIYTSYTSITEEHIKFERYSSNEFLITLDNPNPYPCKYVFTNDVSDDITVVDNNSKQVLVPAKLFPTRISGFVLYMLPKDADVNDYASYPHVFGYLKDKNMPYIGISVNKANSLLHTLNFNRVDTYDINTMTHTFSANQNENISSGAKLNIINNNQLAYDDMYDNIHIFSDYTLKKKITTFKKGINSYLIIGSDKIMIREQSGFNIYDINTNEKLVSKFWEAENPINIVYTYFKVSPKGNYIYVQYTDYNTTNKKTNWVELYELNPNNELVSLGKKSTNKNITLHLNPNNNNELIVQYPISEENKFTIIDIKTNDRKDIKGEFMNIDPFTGNLLYRSGEYSNRNNLYILDKDYSKEKIRIEISDEPWSNSLLINNNLFLNSAHVNLSTLKEWKQ